MNARPSLGFVGIGKVGGTLARLLYARGYAITAVCSRNTAHAAELAEMVGAHIVDVLEQVATLADLIFLTVPDDVVEAISSAFETVDLTGKAVVHTSGVHEAAMLDRLQIRGAMTGSLHPIYPFADVEQSVRGLPGAVFGLQAEDARLRDWLADIIRTLDGQPFMIATGQKALYHSAFVFVSNYSVTLYAIAQHLLENVGGDVQTAAHALDSLMAGMVSNIQLKGVPDALTGPLMRGDVGTIVSHVAALEATDPQLAELYLRLAVYTFPLAQARGVNTEPIEILLRKKMDDADNHT